MSVRILTDSASDISQERAAEWGITVLPLKVRFGDEEFLDGVTLKPKDFFAKLRFMAFLEGVDVFLFCHYCPPVDNVHWRIKAP